MSNKERNLGHIVWCDITVPDAENLKAFYAAVIGWQFESADMGGYNDYSSIASGNRPQHPKDNKMISGVCHARGPNADMPPQWLNYISIDNLDDSLAACLTHGGAQASEIKSYGKDRFCAIKDPAGAFIGLYEISKED